MEAHAHVLELLGLPPEHFDGQVETLLACAVPDDMPALMAIVEPDRLVAAGQQLAFRIRRPNGELRWLGLRCRVEVAPTAPAAGPRRRGRRHLPAPQRGRGVPRPAAVGHAG
ncbi:hypothetical protein SF23_14150, partial [Streptomyces sp. MBRL 10]